MSTTISGTNGVTFPDSTSMQTGQQACKAWVNFDGTFGTSPFTIANGGIRAAYNVSSVTDEATGSYTVNFTTALTDENFSVAATAGNGGGATRVISSGYGATPTTLTARVTVRDSGNNTVDTEYIGVSIFSN